MASVRVVGLLALVLSGCSGILPAVPVEIVGEALVALPQEAVRPLVAEALAPHAALVDGQGDAGPGGDATRYTVVTAPFGDGGTRIRVVRRALPMNSDPSPQAVISRIRTRLEDRAVRVETVAVWTDSLSLADGLCEQEGAELFTPAGPPMSLLPDEIADKSPELIGGLEGLSAQLVYPKLMRDAGVQGRVMLQFIVEPDGSVGCLQATESPPVRLTEAAARAVRASRFTPGLRDGEPARVRFTLPISFVLN